MPVYSSMKYVLKKWNEIWNLICFPSLLSHGPWKRHFRSLVPHLQSRKIILEFLGLLLGHVLEFMVTFFYSSKTILWEEMELLARTPPMHELEKKHSTCEWIKLHAKANSLISRAWLGFSVAQLSAWHPCGNLTTTRGPADSGTNRGTECTRQHYWEDLKGSFSSSETQWVLWTRVGLREAK